MILTAVTFSVNAQFIDGGNITLENGNTVYSHCEAQDQAVILDILLVGQMGENSTWVITDAQEEILEVNGMPPFDVNSYSLDSIKIWHLSFDDINGLVTGIHKDSISGSFDYSNAIDVYKITLTRPKIELIKGSRNIGCGGDEDVDSLVFSSQNANGTYNAFLITDIRGNITHIAHDSIFLADSIQNPICLFQQITYEEGTTNIVIDSTLESIKGCFEISNSILISKNIVNGGDIMMPNGDTTITICVGDGISDAFIPISSDAVGPNQSWIIADTSGQILAVTSFNTFNFEGVGPGQNWIYHIRYFDIDNLSAPNHLDSLKGCFALSNPLWVTRSSGSTSGGNLENLNDSDFCHGDGKPDSLNLNLTGNIADHQIYLITSSSGTILDTFSNTQQDLEQLHVNSRSFIFSLSYQSGIGKLNIGNKVDDLQGCFSLSNSVEINFTITSIDSIFFPSKDTSIIICSNDGIDDNIIIDTSSVMGSIQLVLTDKNQKIITFNSSTEINIDQNLSDTSYLYALVYDGQLIDLENDEFLYNVQGCYSLSNALTIWNSTDAGTPGILSTDSLLTRCKDFTDSDTIFFDIEQYTDDLLFLVLLDKYNTIIRISDTLHMDLGSNLDAGEYSVVNIKPNPFIYDQITIGTKLDSIKGCLNISNAISFRKILLDEGILTANYPDSTTICIINEETLDIDLNISGHQGTSTLFVLTDQFMNVIDINNSNSFDIDSSYPGTIKIFAITFDDVDGLAIGQPLNNLSGCFKLSNSITIYVQKLISGMLVFDDGSQSKEVCVGQDFIDWTWVQGAAASIEYVIRNSNNDTIAIQASDTLHLDNLRSDHYTIVGRIYFDSLQCSAQTSSITFHYQKPEIKTILIGQKDTIIHCKNDLSLENHIQVEQDSLLRLTFLIMNQSDSIIHSFTDTSFVSQSTWPDTVRLVALNHYDTLSSLENQFLSEIDGCFAVSNEIILIQKEIRSGNLLFSDSTTNQTICQYQNDLTILHSGHASESGAYIITSKDSMVIVSTTSLDHLNLDTLDIGDYLIWYIASMDSVMISIGQTLANPQPCWDFSNILQLTIGNGRNDGFETSLDSATLICNDDLSWNITLNYTDSLDRKVVHVVIDNDDNIYSYFDRDSFEIPSDEHYRIISIAYDTIPNIQIGEHFSNIHGCFGTSNFINIDPKINDAGVVSLTIGGNDELHLCSSPDEEFLVDFTLNSQGFIQGIWFLTDHSNRIVDTFSSPTYTFTNSSYDSCYVYHLAYINEDSLKLLDRNIDQIEGCYSISNPILISKSVVNGGNIDIDGEKEFKICSGGQAGSPFNINITNALGNSSAWVLTDQNGTISSITATPPNNLGSSQDSICLLRQVRYETQSISGLTIGQNIEDISGCFDFSDSIRIIKTQLNAGEIYFQEDLKELTICVDDEIEEEITPSSILSTGPNNAWVITDGIGQITDYDVQFPLSFEGQNSGQSFIWLVVYGDDFEGFEVGQYITDLKGCYAITSPLKVIKETGEDCFVFNHHQTINPITIYPNPVKDLIHVNGLQNTVSKLRIYDQMGRLRYSIKQFKNQIDVSSLEHGMYFIHFIDQGVSQVQSFIKI